MDYDKHHDDIVKKREEENIIKQQKELQQRGKSRYIEALLKAGEKRDMEYERTRERMIVKKNSEEESIYGSKDTFVTSAYKRKLAERAKWEENEKAKDEEERLKGGVEVRGMGGFYRNRDAMGGGREGEEKEKEEEEGKEGGGEKKKTKRNDNEFVIEHAPTKTVEVEDEKVKEERRRALEIEEETRKSYMIEEAKERRNERRGKGIEIGVIEHILT
ncbi:hypothetical protein TrCOL_g1179 [Triparma columacea]|uniref:Nuclear speckle splicing regulatory protein 1 N-terminal domain-containing protein n=1 Tax=Triparma columacea TaxID=722753 RepID=A0A9W7LDX6_9STRA|nr:hypothetical protein TrCOL_g1179 [Triparma columacea]